MLTDGLALLHLDKVKASTLATLATSLSLSLSLGIYCEGQLEFKKDEEKRKKKEAT